LVQEKYQGEMACDNIEQQQQQQHYYYYYYYYYYYIIFMQGIHTYVPETNHVSRVYSVAAIVHVLLMVHIALSSILNSLLLLLLLLLLQPSLL
jgi:hypothetical protein